MVWNEYVEFFPPPWFVSHEPPLHQFCTAKTSHEKLIQYFHPLLTLNAFSNYKSDLNNGRLRLSLPAAGMEAAMLDGLKWICRILSPALVRVYINSAPQKQVMKNSFNISQPLLTLNAFGNYKIDLHVGMSWTLRCPRLGSCPTNHKTVVGSELPHSKFSRIYRENHLKSLYSTAPSASAWQRFWTLTKGQTEITCFWNPSNAK